MKRVFLILWQIISIVFLFGGFIYAVFISGSFVVGIIWWGGCIVLNMPMIWGRFMNNENYYTTSHVVIGTIFAFVIAPILLLIKIISSFKKGSRTRSSTSRDERSIDHRPLSSALESAVKSAVYSASKPSGSYVRFESIKNYMPLIYTGKIKLKGTLVYSVQHVSDMNSLESDLKSCIAQANQNILNAVLQSVDTVREKYRGYDDEWQVEVNFGGEIK